MKNVASTYYIESYGCTLNSGDAELIMFKFEELGYMKVSHFKDARFIVINTCGVKTPTEQKILYRIKKISKFIGKTNFLIITGCLPIILKDDLTKITSIAPNFAALIGPKNYHELEEIISKILMGERNIIKIGCQTLAQKVNLKSKPLMKNIGILPIAEGCKGACTYCCTRFARGHLQSYPISAIKAKLNLYIKKGIKEIWITAEDCSAYHDKEEDATLVDLLNELVTIESKFYIRIGMMNPGTLLSIVDGMVEIYQNEKIFKFLHIPVQSGSNRVLKAMNRIYNVEDFQRIVQGFKKVIPDITLSTDIICGFPGETNKEFEDSLTLIKKIIPDIINISMYGHRPGTPASKMKQLNSRIVKGRSRSLTKLHDKISPPKLKKWVGWKGEAIVEDYNKKKQNYLARNSHYKPIIVDNVTLGSIIQLKVVEARKHYLVGKMF